MLSKKTIHIHVNVNINEILARNKSEIICPPLYMYCGFKKTCGFQTKNLWVSKKLVSIKFCRFPEFHGFEDHIGSPTYLAMFPS